MTWRQPHIHGAETLGALLKREVEEREWHLAFEKRIRRWVKLQVTAMVSASWLVLWVVFVYPPTALWFVEHYFLRLAAVVAALQYLQRWRDFVLRTTSHPGEMK